MAKSAAASCRPFAKQGQDVHQFLCCVKAALHWFRAGSRVWRGLSAKPFFAQKRPGIGRTPSTQFKASIDHQRALHTFQRLMWFSRKMNDNRVACAYHPAVDHDTHDARTPDQLFGFTDQNG